MMGRVSVALIHLFIRQNWIEIENDGQFDCYVYILYTGLLRWLLWASILCLSLVTGNIRESILFLLTFSWMRKVSGGYHSDSAVRCFLLSLASYGALLLSLQLTPAWQSGIIVASLFISFFLFFCFAPRLHANDPKSKEEKRMLRQYSIISCVAVSGILMLGIWVLPMLGSYLMAIAMGMGIAGISLLLSWITEWKGTSKHEKENRTATKTRPNS